MYMYMYCSTVSEFCPPCQSLLSKYMLLWCLVSFVIVHILAGHYQNVQKEFDMKVPRILFKHVKRYGINSFLCTFTYICIVSVCRVLFGETTLCIILVLCVFKSSGLSCELSPGNGVVSTLLLVTPFPFLPFPSLSILFPSLFFPSILFHSFPSFPFSSLPFPFPSLPFPSISFPFFPFHCLTCSLSFCFLGVGGGTFRKIMCFTCIFQAFSSFFLHVCTFCNKIWYMYMYVLDIRGEPDSYLIVVLLNTCVIPESVALVLEVSVLCSGIQYQSDSQEVLHFQSCCEEAGHFLQILGKGVPCCFISI